MGLFNNSDIERRLQAIEAKFEHVQSFVGVSVLSDASKEIKSEALHDWCQALSDQMDAMVKASESLFQMIDAQKERIDVVEQSMIGLHDRMEAQLKLSNFDTDALKVEYKELATYMETTVAIRAVVRVMLEDLSKQHVSLEQVRKHLGMPGEILSKTA